MKLDIYKEKEDTVYLKLVEGDSGGINVIAVNREGSDLSMLLSFLPDGSILRMESIDSRLGFDLDDKGRIIFG